MTELPQDFEEPTPDQAPQPVPDELLAPAAQPEAASEPETPPASPEQQQKGLRKILSNDFFIGFVISFLIAFLTSQAIPIATQVSLLGLRLLGLDTIFEFPTMIASSILWLILNIVLLVILAIKRRGMFYGMLAGYALIFMFVLLLTAVCFALFYGIEGGFN